ncbi:Hypothetical_protein [Hexamita inflata]|uniref:Hypothetical_protein n=1 Tax=Hexamita inflata TaxID=28002 RepID=A0AA86QWM9_9EUKA|nr:Hypothetical protein HINF_LOCUS52227 [Hexamita inflata]
MRQIPTVLSQLNLQSRSFYIHQQSALSFIQPSLKSIDDDICELSADFENSQDFQHIAHSVKLICVLNVNISQLKSVLVKTDSLINCVENQIENVKRLKRNHQRLTQYLYKNW